MMALTLTLYGGCTEKPSAKKTILVTAFEPFGGDDFNPTQMVLERLPDSIDGYELKKMLLPVEFVRCLEVAFAEYDSCSPDAVIMLGQAGGRAPITPETTGKNIMNAPIPDNAGYQPQGIPIVENGPDVLHSTFPVDKIIEAVRTEGISCEKSDDAGEYVCNNMLYGMLEHNKGEVPTGFIHVPFIPEQGYADYPYMELDVIEKGIIAAIRAVISDLNSNQ